MLNTAIAAGALYDFGGLRVSSPFDLPGLTAIREECAHEQCADIHLSLVASPPPTGRHIFQWFGRYRLALEACGDDWLIRQGAETGVKIADCGRALQCHCPDPARLPLLSEIIVRRVLPRVSVFHGRLPIHAATLGDEKGATMLLGSSGAGKSTMTAALALNLGWDIFSDDMSIVGDEGRHVVFPALPGVSVWQESMCGLGLPPEHCRPVLSYEGKVWYSRALTKAPLPRPLEGVILLSFDPDSDRIEYKRLSGPHVLVIVSSQLVPFNPRDSNQAAALMARFKRMIAEVPVYSLAYPRDYRALPHVVDAIRKLHTDVRSQLA